MLNILDLVKGVKTTRGKVLTFLRDLWIYRLKVMQFYAPVRVQNHLYKKEAIGVFKLLSIKSDKITLGLNPPAKLGVLTYNFGWQKRNKYFGNQFLHESHDFDITNSSKLFTCNR